MGAQPTKPEREEADELRKNVPQACSEAADAILDADVLLLATGAGWSAESGLAVYRDIARGEGMSKDTTYLSVFHCSRYSIVLKNPIKKIPGIILGIFLDTLGTP